MPLYLVCFMQDHLRFTASFPSSQGKAAELMKDVIGNSGTWISSPNTKKKKEKETALGPLHQNMV